MAQAPRRSSLLQAPHRSRLLPSTHPAPTIRSGSRSRVLPLAHYPRFVAQAPASLPPSSSRSHRSHPRKQAQVPSALAPNGLARARASPLALYPHRWSCRSRHPKPPCAAYSAAGASRSRPGTLAPAFGPKFSGARVCPQALQRFFSATHRSAAGCALAPTSPRRAPARSRLTPAQIPPALPHGVFPAHLARPLSPALAASAPAPPSPRLVRLPRVGSCRLSRLSPLARGPPLPRSRAHLRRLRRRWPRVHPFSRAPHCQLSTPSSVARSLPQPPFPPSCAVSPP